MPFQEVVVVVEVFFCEYSFLEHLYAEFALCLHDQLQHFIVVPSWKEEVVGE